MNNSLEVRKDWLGCGWSVDGDEDEVVVDGAVKDVGYVVEGAWKDWLWLWKAGGADQTSPATWMDIWSDKRAPAGINCIHISNSSSDQLGICRRKRERRMAAC
jgi:hypothetical protein